MKKFLQNKTLNQTSPQTFRLPGSGFAYLQNTEYKKKAMFSNHTQSHTVEVGTLLVTMPELPAGAEQWIQSEEAEVLLCMQQQLDGFPVPSSPAFRYVS